MVDWMFEVIRAFSMSSQTFYLSVQYLDRFLEQTEKEVAQNDIHLLGIAAMFVASKFEDVIPLFMKTMIIRVSHGRLTERQILSAERELCTTLKWKLSSCPTSLEYLNVYLSHSYFSKLSEISEIREISGFLTLICLHHI